MKSKSFIKNEKVKKGIVLFCAAALSFTVWKIMTSGGTKYDYILIAVLLLDIFMYARQK